MEMEGALSYESIVRTGDIPPGLHCTSAKDSGLRLQMQVAAKWMFSGGVTVFSDHLYTARFAARLGAKHIFWAHLIEFDPPLDPMHTRALRNCRRIVCNSNFTKRAILDLYPECENKMEVVTLGDRPRDTLDGPKYHGNLPQQTLVMIGRMAVSERYKGHDQVIDALHAVRDRFPACRIRMIGNGDDRQRLQEKVDSLGLEDRVDFATTLSDDELISAVKNSAGLLLPSLREGFGLVYLYALWAGVPAIAVRGTAGEEVLGECGIYADTQSSSDIAAAMAVALSGCWQHAVCSQTRYAERFCYAAFKKRFAEFLLSINP